MKIIIPKDVKYIINKLYENGYEAFIVGGCVRDLLLRRIPNDYDVTTNAAPDEIVRIFKEYKNIDNGIKHGTVGLIINKEIYEVTTYRIEKEYEHNRRPKEVEFTTSIEDDLKRRDFTINAIAYNDKIGIVDIFNGIKDIEAEVIKTVGNPDERFTEDGLRMMRAIRLSSQLNFKIEEETLKSIHRNANIIKNISLERISEEFTKTLLSNNPEKIEIYYSSKIFDKLGIYNYLNDYNKYKSNIAILKECTPILEERLLMLEYIFINKKLKEINEEDEKIKFYRQHMRNKSFVNILKYPKKLTNNINLTTEYMIIEYNNLDKIKIKKILNKIGKENLKVILRLKKMYYTNYSRKDKKNKIKILNNCINTINEIEKNNECYLIKDLDINGSDLKELGYNGVEIGDKLNFLLEEVMKYASLNERNTLIKLIKN